MHYLVCSPEHMYFIIVACACLSTGNMGWVVSKASHYYWNAMAIAYVMQKIVYILPIIRSRKIEQFHENLEALEISLSNKQIAYLESVQEFDFGFPGNMIVCGCK